jgi:Holliday junction resolvasome RuvABC endonuclease subunit
MSHRDPPDFVLGVHPTSRGFGWMLFEGPLSPFDWGTVEIEHDKHHGTLARIKKLSARYRPSVLILEEFEGEATRRARRIRRICHAIISAADDWEVAVAVYSRAQIQSAFATTGARTRAEIAHAVLTNVAALRYRTPPPQKPWIGEHPNTSLFSATACVLTHYALTQGRAWQ